MTKEEKPRTGDKPVSAETSTDQGSRVMVARLMGVMSGLVVLAGFYPLFQSHAGLKFSTALGTFLLGVALVYLAMLIARPPQTLVRRPYWWPVFTGMICSACAFACFALFYYFYKTPNDDIQEWFRFVFAFMIAASAVSAAACLGTGLHVILKSGANAEGAP